MKKIALFLLFALAACNSDDVPAPGPGPAPEVDIMGKLGFRESPTGHFGKPYFVPRAPLKAAPETFDWAAQGVSTPVRDQGQCGSCWAFASVQTLEGATKRVGKHVDLSEQDVNSGFKESYGCSGGWFAGSYLVNGVLKEEDCPYKASNQKCPTGKPVGAKAISYAYVGQANRKPTIDEIKDAILTRGFVSVTVSAHSGWGSYKSGLFSNCRNGQTNHMVALTGWTKNGWIMKNSWGLQWGNQGFMEIKYGCDRIGEEAAYIVYETTPQKPPAAKLPAEIKVFAGDEVLLVVKQETGVDYAWYRDGKKVSDKNEVVVIGDVDSVYKLVAKNTAGTLEVETKVVVVAPPKEDE